jgi:succinate dehydrogenase / fumarate reductase cytochrome b subunit
MAETESAEGGQPEVERPEGQDGNGGVAPSETFVKPAATAEAASPPLRGRHRRLHTLAGALVLGAYLIVHLLTNASALGGPGSYDAVVGAIQRWKLLPLIEVVFVLVPLSFHAGYGIHLLRKSGTPDAEIERYGENRLLWVIQRISALFVLVFVIAHVWELRVQKLLFGLSAESFYTTLAAHLSWTWASVPWIALFYLLGIFAVTVHFSNGVFAATASWGVGTNPAGRRLTRALTVAVGVVLFTIGAMTVIGLATGTRLLPGADGDSAARAMPCGSAVGPPPSLKLPSTPSR